ncbi:MAG: hypothetical protein AAGF47_06015 [Planctomycetota bacterium]
MTPMADGKPQAPLMLGVSGLRGIVGESLTPEVAMRFAGAFAAWVRENHANQRTDPNVVVGWDGRSGGESIHSWVMTILEYAGLGVYDAGIMTTPTLGVVADSHNAHAVQITASHNPFPWNGIKLLIRPVEATERGAWAAAPTAAVASEIIRMFEGAPAPLSFNDGARWKSLEAGLSIHGGAIIQELGESETTRDHDYFRVFDSSFFCVLDSVNASGGPAAASLMDSLNCRYVQLHGDNSGIFPHTPEPTAENLSGEGGLCDAVPGLKADIGFAQDPDGDRLAIVDETGRYIGEEYTLALCAVSILEANKHAPPSPKGELSAQPTEGVSFDSEKTPFDPAGTGPPPPSATGEDVFLCANLSTSRMVDDIAARYGATVVRTAVGEANVVEAMKRLKREGRTVLLGGEGNGGVIWPEVTYVRDSLGSMALVLSLMARTGKTVSQLVADIPSYAIVKRKQPLANKADAQPAIERIAKCYSSEDGSIRVDTQDGVRVDFDDKKAWVHVRASNTEPILRLIAEAGDETTANAILDNVGGLVDE